MTCSVGCECPNADDLKLGPNNPYRDWVKQAAKHVGRNNQRALRRTGWH